MGIPQGPGHLLPGCSGVELGGGDKPGVTFWISTEADRSSTCILLPEEY